MLDTTLKDMLMSLQSSIHSDIFSMVVHNFKAEITDLSDRVSNIESEMGEFTTSFNDLVDAHREKVEDLLKWMKAKLADLEDRYRRNNMKIKGIPESVQPLALKEYFAQLMAAFLLDTPTADLVTNRIHRLPKPPHLPDNTPRDTIGRINFFHVKERLMEATRNISSYPQPYANLTFYADLSQYTILKRKNLSTITKPISNHQITYKWGIQRN